MFNVYIRYSSGELEQLINVGDEVVDAMVELMEGVGPGTVQRIEHADSSYWFDRRHIAAMSVHHVK